MATRGPNRRSGLRQHRLRRVSAGGGAILAAANVNARHPASRELGVADAAQTKRCRLPAPSCSKLQRFG